ncbi:uncharacterized [Tachysurus ichikawai]
MWPCSSIKSSSHSVKLSALRNEGYREGLSQRLSSFRANGLQKAISRHTEQKGTQSVEEFMQKTLTQQTRTVHRTYSRSVPNQDLHPSQIQNRLKQIHMHNTKKCDTLNRPVVRCSILS